MKQDIHLAWDYRACFEAMRSTFGDEVARASDGAKTKALCGAKVPVARAKGLDELVEVDCIVCLTYVAKEGKNRDPRAKSAHIKKRVARDGRHI